MTNPRRVLVVSSQRLFRDGLCSLLNGHTEIAVVAPEGDPAAILSDLARYAPEVVILDAKDFPNGQNALSDRISKVISVTLDEARLTAFSELVIENAHAEDLIRLVRE